MKQTRTTRRKKMQRLLTKWEASGMPLRAFCETVDVSYHKLKYWKYKLDPVNQKIDEKPIPPQEREAGFITVEIPKATSFAGLELSFPNNVKITCPSGIGVEELKTLIKLF